jgi:hypothetical protein
MPTWAKALLSTYVLAVLAGVALGRLFPRSSVLVDAFVAAAILLLVSRISGWPGNRKIT